MCEEAGENRQDDEPGTNQQQDVAAPTLDLWGASLKSLHNSLLRSRNQRGEDEEHHHKSEHSDGKGCERTSKSAYRQRLTG